MKTKQILCTLTLMAGIAGLMTSCASKKVQQSSGAAGAVNPFGAMFTPPGFEPDTDEYFTALGTSYGSRNTIDVLQEAALTNAQNIVRQKMQHAYKGLIADYSKYIANENGSNTNSKMERAGDQIIDVIVNDTKAQNIQFSPVDEKGNMDCFVNIRVNKKQLAEKISKAVSEDEELKIRFEEKQFREYMENKFKEYKEEQKQ